MPRKFAPPFAAGITDNPPTPSTRAVRTSPRAARQQHQEAFPDITQPTREEIARDYLIQRGFAREQVKRLLNAFYILNAAVLSFILLIWVLEFIVRMIGDRGGNPPSAHPLITERVILALIAASAAQLGALAFAVGRGSLLVGQRRDP